MKVCTGSPDGAQLASPLPARQFRRNCSRDDKIRVFIILLAPRAGKMKRTLCSDWLPERARWAYLARSGLPALVTLACVAGGISAREF